MKTVKVSLFLFLTFISFYIPIQADVEGKASESTIAALDGKGNPVDWWYILKLPSQMLDKSGKVIDTPCDCNSPKCSNREKRAPISERSIGLCYLYADSNKPELTYFRDLDYDCLGQGGNDPVSHTLKQIVQHKTSDWAFFNDDFSKIAGSSFGSTSCSGSANFNAHSKGALCFDQQGGFHMQSTTPNFPDPSSGNEKFIPLGCQVGDNVKFSQHFFTMSLDSKSFDTLASGLQSARFCSANQFKRYRNQLVSKGLQNSDTPMGKAMANDKLPVYDTKVVSLKTKFSGIDIKMIAKSKTSVVPPWALVAEKVQNDISVATWLDKGYGIPTICGGDHYLNGSSQYCLINEPDEMTLPDGGAEFNVENLLKASWKEKGFSWNLVAEMTSGNHGKWGMSTNRNGENGKQVIFGDMNMQGFPCSSRCEGSQASRGGSFFVLENPTLWKSMIGIVESVCSCDKNNGDFITNRMCNKGCTGKVDQGTLPSITGKAKSFWSKRSKST